MTYSNPKHLGVVNYTGNKTKLMRQLLPLFPESCGRFVDVCCGSLAVSMSVPYTQIVANDLETRLIEVYLSIRDLGREETFAELENLIDSFDLDKENKSGYLEFRDYYNTEDRSPINLLVLLYHAFSNQIRFNEAGEFNMPFGVRTFNPSLQNKLHLFFDFLEARDIEFTNSSYSKMELREDDFLYIDPPYLITDATYNKYWSSSEDKNMMEWLDSLPCKWGMSNVFEHKGKQNTALMEWAKKHNTSILSDVQYISGAYQGKNTDKPTVEVYIRNY